jgi:hypothetical protein
LLARRDEGPDLVQLYRMAGGYLVEVRYDGARHQLTGASAFASAERGRLAAYAAAIELRMGEGCRTALPAPFDARRAPEEMPPST